MDFVSGIFTAFIATTGITLGRESGSPGEYIPAGETILYDGNVVTVARTGTTFSNLSLEKAIDAGLFIEDLSYPNATLELLEEGTSVGRFSAINVIGTGTTVVESLTPGRADLLVAGGGIEILDEGTSLGTFDKANFIGADIRSQQSGTIGQANIFVPPPAFASHWNTADGSTGNQSVQESLSRTGARISTPFGGEGSPFKTNGWDGSDRPASLNGVVTFTTPSVTTGFGGDSTIEVRVYDADGATLLDSFTTPALTGNGVSTSPSTDISVTISSYGADSSRFSANASVQVDISNILTGAGLSGGRYHIEADHTVDTATDGSGTYTYTQADVFLDSNPTTPEINGSTTINETSGGVVTKFLSGLEYYTLGSQFTVSAQDIDQLNRNTARSGGNLIFDGSEYGLPALSHSPFGSGSSNFSGWTNNNNQDNVDYQKTDWAITAANYRYIGPSANITGTPRDPWSSGSAQNTADARVMIDTFGTTSTDTVEDFNDEARREFIDGVGAGASIGSFAGIGTWDSSLILPAGQALVFGGQLMAPGASTFIRSDGSNDPNADWTSYSPGGPDYGGILGVNDFGRRFLSGTASPLPSFSLNFTGDFAAGDALSDITSGNLEIYVYRIAAASLGNFGPPPINNFPLRVHEPFNFAIYDDGATVAGSGVREGSSAGNNINCTFGTGTPATTGFYCHIRVVNPATKISSITAVFA